jgi:tRNA(Arg) A34 adenosine deaminase TadA
MTSVDHEFFIRESYELARRAAERGNHPFGALLVKQGEIILRAENSINSDRDITHHAELNLVSRASRQLSAEMLAESTLYASTEPCAMCAGAIYWAGIQFVVYGCSAESLAGVTGGGRFVVPCRVLFAMGTDSPQVIGPVLETEGIQTLRRFWR